MTFRERLIQRPQTLWVRKALFQVHLWTGLITGLYLVAVSVSGSAIVFRREISRAVSRGPIVVEMTGERLTPEQLTAMAQRTYPGYRVSKVWKARRPDLAVDVWMENGGTKKQRLFDPYSGRDLGDTVPSGLRALDWVVDFHDNLLADQTGRLVNGIGALCLVLLSVTGMAIWWPGIATWRRNTIVRWNVSWKRFNWDLHSVIGFWTALFVLMWAISGVYLAFPRPFSALVDFMTPSSATSVAPRTGDVALEWLAKLHFGRFAGWRVKTLWTMLGLAPPLLFVTGTIIWWNRVVGPERRATRRMDKLIDNRALAGVKLRAAQED